MSAHELRKSLLTELRFGPKRKCVAAGNSQKPEFTKRTKSPSSCRATNAPLRDGLDDRDDQHVNMKQLSHGGNCSIALRISSREIVRPTESNVHRGQADLVSEADSSI